MTILFRIREASSSKIFIAGFKRRTVLQNTMTKSTQAHETSSGYMELLRGNRNFRLLWLGQVVSQLGDWFDTIAVYTIVLHLTGSGRAIGLVLVARFVPSFLAGPLSGVVADRFSRRRIMIASDVGRAVIVLGFLFIRRPDQMWIVYALSVLQLTFSTFFEPAKTAVIPSIVQQRELVAANAVSTVTWSVMLTLGAAAGGLVTGLFGTNAAFILDSLTYIASAVLISRVRFPKRAPRPAKSRFTFGKALGITDTFEGMRYVAGRPRVLALLLVKPAWGLGGGVLTLLAVFGEKVFPVAGQAGYGIGILYAARGIGTALGPIAAKRLAGERRTAMQIFIGVGFFVGGVFYIAFATARSLPLAIPLLMLAHTGGSVIWVFSTVLLQISVEDEFRGRVFAAELALLTLMMAASNYLTGELLDRFHLSPRVVTIGMGLIFLLPGVAWFATRRWWDDGGRGETIPHETIEMIEASTPPEAKAI
ncbi:MAG: MFS transporter [Pyrinomonadaceae bacterium]